MIWLVGHYDDWLKHELLFMVHHESCPVGCSKVVEVHHVVCADIHKVSFIHHWVVKALNHNDLAIFQCFVCGAI